MKYWIAWMHCPRATTSMSTGRIFYSHSYQLWAEWWALFLQLIWHCSTIIMIKLIISHGPFAVLSFQCLSPCFCSFQCKWFFLYFHYLWSGFFFKKIPIFQILWRSQGECHSKTQHWWDMLVCYSFSNRISVCIFQTISDKHFKNILGGNETYFWNGFFSIFEWKITGIGRR